MLKKHREVLAIRHVGFEDLGAFEPVLKNAGFHVRYHDIGVDDVAGLFCEEPALLFILGGPIGAYEEDCYPFLLDELALIERRLKMDLPTFGICLGAQLMARALGARVYPGSAKELGFAPITLTDAGLDSCLRFFNDVDVLHWHGDTFDLPAGAKRLASSPICQNQAFTYGANAIAVQFHPEAGGPGFERWLIGHTLELSTLKVDVRALRREWRERSAVLAARARNVFRCGSQRCRDSGSSYYPWSVVLIKPGFLYSTRGAIDFGYTIPLECYGGLSAAPLA